MSVCSLQNIPFISSCRPWEDSLQPGDITATFSHHRDRICWLALLLVDDDEDKDDARSTRFVCKTVNWEDLITLLNNNINQPLSFSGSSNKNRVPPAAAYTTSSRAAAMTIDKELVRELRILQNYIIFKRKAPLSCCWEEILSINWNPCPCHIHKKISEFFVTVVMLLPFI